jgi:putative ABC transport system permease protein
MNGKLLIKTGWRYLLRHPWQSILMILGITLGVAVVIAVDLANASASRAFDLSTQSVAGKATHQIDGGPTRLNESIYIALRNAGLEIPLAPVVSQYVISPQLGGQPLQLLGIDPFAEAPFRDYLGPSSSADLSTFLTQSGAILLSQALAQRYDLQIGDQITLEVAGQVNSAFIAGLLTPADRLSQRALNGLILADIATAQELTDRIGLLDRIDMILPEKDIQAMQAVIEEQLPDGVRMIPVAARSGTVEQMTAAFRVNLTALSLLAMVVGMFLIYNTITFSVVQRRPFFGTLRCLGVTRREVFFLVIIESAVVGGLGAILGSLLGIVMGQGAVRLVTQTINDLFFVVTVRGVQVPVLSLVKGSLLGILATLLTAAPPAWEAATVPPRAALSRANLESKTKKSIYLAAGTGLALIFTGIILLIAPLRSLVASFAGTFMIVVGFAMLVPLGTGVFMQAATSTLGRLMGTLGRMAPRNVASSLSRTSIAVMALMVAVAVTIGVSLMVSSFRATVVTWLRETLQGDIYISAPSPTATTPSTPLDPKAIALLKEWPEVASIYVLRSVNVDSPQGSVHIAATDNANVPTERVYLSNDVPEEEIWQQMVNGAVLVSEPFANRLNLPRHGGSISLYTAQGQQDFPIIGIYYDYASTQGTVLMSLDIYRQHWLDSSITAAAMRFPTGTKTDQIAIEIQEALTPIQRLLVRPNQALRNEVLQVFDRTFAITSALQLLATIVAFIGVLSALLSLELERQRELGILRSIGLTVRQVWALITIETGLMGAVAGLLAMPTGYALALILVYIINRRSFGWTLQMQVDPTPFLQALTLAIGAALLAGIYPALRIGRMVTSEALRSE